MPPTPAAQPHGPLQELFPDVFFVTGTMQTTLMNAHWHFSRNMTVIRDGRSLTLVNTVRLDDDGLARLDELGEVTDVVRIGSLHGIDDAFYLERHGARFWAAPGMPLQDGLVADHALVDGGDAPFAGGRVFAFESTRLPECILRIDRAGGVLVACDSLQNWLGPDAFFSEESREMMAGMGFFQRANIGPLWKQVNEPHVRDFDRLRELEFRHVLCGHGSPLLDDAFDAYAARFEQAFAT